MYKDDLKDMIIKHFTEHPNTSPRNIIESLNEISTELGGIAAGLICIMREREKILINTGIDENGDVLLSIKGESTPMNYDLQNIEDEMRNLRYALAKQLDSMTAIDSNYGQLFVYGDLKDDLIAVIEPVLAKHLKKLEKKWEKLSE